MALTSLVFHYLSVWYTWIVLHHSTSELLWTWVLAPVWTQSPLVPRTHIKHHSYHPTNMSTYHAPPPEISDSDHEMERVPSPISENKKTWGLAMHVPIKVDNTLKPTTQGPTIGTITAAFDIVPSLQGSLPLDPPSEPPTMSVNITTTSPALNVPNRGMQGVPPAIFDGMQSRADEFWSQFCCYKLVNWAHKSMTKTLWQGTHGTHIYIQGPMIND